jgi:P27 family predicted phage terminase small subunit
MGRKADDPTTQAAKGFPSRRRSKTERAIAEAERLAKLLADAPADPVGAPSLLADARMAPALQVWKDYAPQLRNNNLLDATDRHTFAVFCVFMADFAAANEEILLKGYSVNVKTVSGDKMPRDNPAVSRREIAVKFILELSKRFGLTPLDRYQLMKDQAHQNAPGPLFRPRPDETPDEAPAPADEDVVGLLSKLDSAPPGTPVN